MPNFLASNLRLLRKNKYSQQKLADILNIKRSAVGSYEEGRAMPDVELLRKIANIFSITLDELLFYDFKNKVWDLKPEIRRQINQIKNNTVNRGDTYPPENFPADGNPNCLNCLKMEIKYFEARDYLIAKEAENKKLIAENAVLKHDNQQLRKKLIKHNKNDT